MKKRRIFISTSSKTDMTWVRGLADALTHHGLVPWLEKRDFGHGEGLGEKVEEALRSSSAVVFIITGDSYERSNLFFELGFAKALGKQSVFVIPGNHDVSWIPSGLRDEELVVKKSPKETAAALAATLSAEDYSGRDKRSESWTATSADSRAGGPDDSRSGKPADSRGGALDNSRVSAETEKDAELEFALNPEPRVPCVLVLDTSGSMAGQPIAELNKAIDRFRDFLRSDTLANRRADLAIVSFGSHAHIVKDFSTPIEADNINLTAGGATAMGSALEMAVDMLNERKAAYNRADIPCYRPWIILITDGSPTDSWQQAAERIRKGVTARTFAFFAIGVEGADMETLAQIDPEPRRLRGLDFSALFTWLSASLKSVTSVTPNQMTPLPPTDWESI